MTAQRIPPLRMDIKIRNNALVRRREDLNLSAPKFAKAVGMSYGQYLAYENLQCHPLYRDNAMTRSLGKLGCWREGALKIAKFHGVSPTELWPECVLELKKVRASIEADPEQFTALAGMSRSLPPSPESHAEEQEMQSLISGAILDLEPMEQAVLRERFGLGRSGADHTLEEVGQDFSVTRERVRLIEARALKKLRTGPLRERLVGLIDPSATLRDASKRLAQMRRYATKESIQRQEEQIDFLRRKIT